MPTALTNTDTVSDGSSLDCDGYRSLLSAVERDEKQSPGFHDYRGKLVWIISRARNYADKTGLRAEAILDAWESDRDYWYMNYYQESRQPEITGAKARVFENTAALLTSIGTDGFRCPSCAGVSKSPYECTAGKTAQGKVCDWKVYGLFGHMGKGVTVYVKEALKGEQLFMPIAWENSEPKQN